MLTPRRCAVLGHPVGHSLSPAMHRAAYARLGLPWRYDAIDVGTDRLAGFVAGLDDEWRGLSLTMPLKRAVLPLLDEVSDLAAEVQACNTVLLDGGRLVGDNTDVPGIVAALTEAGIERVTSAVVLGGGATADSAVAALHRLGATALVLTVRDAGRAEMVVERARAYGMEVDVVPLGAPWQHPVDLLMSTIPASATPAVSDTLLAGVGAVFDCVYDPWKPELTIRAEAAGRSVLTGLDLLAHQAVLQVELMTGATVPVDLLRDAALTALLASEEP